MAGGFSSGDLNELAWFMHQMMEEGRRGGGVEGWRGDERASRQLAGVEGRGESGEGDGGYQKRTF